MSTEGNSAGKFFDFRQTGILAERYLDVILGDLKSTLILLLQAPVIAVLIVLAWKNMDPDKNIIFCYGSYCRMVRLY